MTTSTTTPSPLHAPPRAADPRWDRARLVTFWLASGAFALGAGEFASMSLLPSFARDLGVDEGRAGHAISAYALGVVIGAPLLAVFTARLPRKPVLLALLGLFVVGNGLSAVAPGFTTLEAARFIAGIPHGAFFAIAMLFAASMARPEQRAQAVSYVSLGLATATVVGVPLITWAGQQLGWRAGFVIVGGLAALTLVALWRIAPHPDGDPSARPASEIRALRNPHVMLTLLAGAIGFGGMFSVYSYFSSVFVTSHAGPEWAVAPVLMLYGLGLAAGNLVAGRLAHGRTLTIAIWFQAFLGLACAAYALCMGSGLGMTLTMVTIGFGGGMTVPLQTRLMDVAGEAQTLAAALNHVAFNMANALGPFLAGLAMSAGWGAASTGWVGVALAALGVVLLVATARFARRRAFPSPPGSPETRVDEHVAPAPGG